LRTRQLSANGVLRLKKLSLAIFTSTRADYGVLSPLINLLRDDPLFSVSLLITGTHLLKDFGNTGEEISRYENVETKVISSIDFDTDRPERLAKYFSHILGEVTRFVRDKHIDYLVLLGDRLELLPVVLAGTVSQTPIIHLYGGELTHGAIDDAIRHATTKLSHIHFTSCDKYRDRVISLGEQPSFVFNVGALFVDNFRDLKALDAKSLEDLFGFRFDSATFLVTFHPETMQPENTASNLQIVLDSVLELYKDFKFFFTLGNNDPLGRQFNQQIQDFVKTLASSNVSVAPSMGKTGYLSALRLVAGVVGNSSSGIIEVPYFDIPTVNIGARQEGREMPDSVIRTKVNQKDIVEAIRFSQTREFKETIRASERIFGRGDSAQKIIDILKKIGGSRNMKIFYEA
jgi:GDP/UDP-N,N'-diacetylbacillosamine 2-epimerase (hydrolysing)